MIVSVYAVTVLLFCLAFRFTRLIPTAMQAVTIARQAVETMSTTSLDDFAKEKAVQQAALKMITNCGQLFIKGAAIVAAAVLPIWLADILKLATVHDTSQFALRRDVLIVTTIVVMAAVMSWNKLRQNQTQ